VALYFTGRVPQDLEYHLFTDSEEILGISNFHNVLSNLPFLLVSIMGIKFLLKNNQFEGVFEKVISWTLILSMGFLCFGSSFYHYNPNNFTLVWDRLPMTLIFSSLFSLVLWDQLGEKVGRWAFIVFIPLGTFSVFYWWYTELMGLGDLRPYIFVQFFPMLSIPVILIFSRNRYHLKPLIYVTVFYFLAKIFENFDREFLEMVNYSGHSLKHIFAAISAYFIFDFIKERVKCHIDK